jgi:beta-glucosidase/6-phospho-beta-glucosidase/beta-galactosidase
LYKEDIKMMKDLGFKHYRFSISWTRIMPFELNKIDPEGIQFYHHLIDECLKNNITPYATIYHWDLPVYIQNSWLNESIVDFFFDYSLILFKEYGEKIHHWMTINEPLTTSMQGYGNSCNFAPGYCSEDNMYLSAHHQLLAHAKTGKYYLENYPDGKISIVLNTNWFEPVNSDAEYHAHDYMDRNLGWFLNPIMSGEYPEIMKSKCPQFTQDQKHELINSFNFLAINHYTSYLVHQDGSTSTSPEWTQGQSVWLFDAPFGLNRLLHYIHDKYTKTTPIVITECGFSQKNDKLLDLDRSHYYIGYINALLRAQNEGVKNIIGFFAWSLLDNFEWASGYKEKFGIIQVEKNYTREIKLSATLLSSMNQLLS